MQVILGGAYNGKQQFVNEQLHNINQSAVFTFEGQLPKEMNFTHEQYVILGRFERLIVARFDEDELLVANEICEAISKLASQTNVICICTDMSRGIVPLDKSERFMRDCCGRIYQRLCLDAREVIRVWYGIPQIIKGES